MRRVDLVLTLLLPCVLAAQQRRPVDEAWELLAKGDRARASQALSRILKTNPKDAEAHLMLGSLLAEDGRSQEALPHLEQAVLLRPGWAEAHHALGAAFKGTGRQREALGEFGRAVKLKPGFAQARVDLALALLDSGDPKAAAEQLDSAIRLFGTSDEAAFPTYLRAKILLDRGGIEPAAKLFERAVALRPDFAEAWSELGQARKTLLDDDGALDAFQKSVKADPENAVSQCRLGAEYLRRGEIAPAVDHLRQSYRINPKNQTMLNSLQLALRRAGQPEEAKRIREELAAVLREIDRESQAAFQALRLNNEGAALEKQGNMAAAADKYKEALTLDPSHNGIRVNFAVASLRLGRWNEGLAELREAVRREPNNAKWKAALEDALKQAPPEIGGSRKQ